MESHRGHVGGALLGLGGLCWITDVSVALLNNSFRWTNPYAIGLGVAGLLCFIGAVSAFGFWDTILRPIGRLASWIRSVPSAVANWTPVVLRSPVVWRGFPSLRRLPNALVARAAFQQPQNRSTVDRTPTVTGRSGGITEGTELWAVVVSSRPERRYHPQVAALPITSDGSFDAIVYIGLADSTGNMQLLLVLVDKTDGDGFRQYIADGNRTQTYAGLQMLPPSSKILDEIVVTRA
ncbi:MAG: hypothetical protein ACLP50_02745 [Solirubrobacteraceae bacterium]